MAVTLHAVNKGYFDDVEVAKALAVEKQMQAYVKENHAALLGKIEETKEFPADVEKELDAAIEKFKATLA
jgi:F-type H+-transporting ATPase subunit alpha